MGSLILKAGLYPEEEKSGAKFDVIVSQPRSKMRKKLSFYCLTDVSAPPAELTKYYWFCYDYLNCFCWVCNCVSEELRESMIYPGIFRRSTEFRAI